MFSALLTFSLYLDVLITEPEFEDNVGNNNGSDVQSNQSSGVLFQNDINTQNCGLDISESKKVDHTQSALDW